MNAFDLVVTVAPGSTLASIVASDRLPLANGLLALALLIGLQFVVAWSNVRPTWFRRLVKSEPTLLLLHGVLMENAMRRSRIAGDEVLSAVRCAGARQLTDVAAVVLEPDGSLSVIQGRLPPPEEITLSDVPISTRAAAAASLSQRGVR